MNRLEHKAALWVLIALLGGVPLLAQTSYKTLDLKTPKHYFNTVLSLDGYRKPEVQLKDTSEPLNRRLKSYGIRQFNLNLCAPLVTIDGKDTTVMSNSHILLTVNYNSLRPQFSGISDHRLTKFGVGLRYIYNTGKKGVWFFEVSPFATRDVTFRSAVTYRMASTVVYSHNASERLNFRVGISKSFQWGNRFYWPFIGLRLGRLDKAHISIQFPRNVEFVLPVGHKVILSMYARPQGGMYNFSNQDSLYFNTSDKVFNFTRYELNSGLRVDVRASKHFNFYLAIGTSSRNNITFYSERANARHPRLPYRRYFYTQDVPRTGFLNLGLVFVFGKTRSYYNNKNLYDAADLQNNVDQSGNPRIPLPAKKKRSDANLESVLDLVDYNEL